jgi:hypothetical protein
MTACREKTSSHARSSRPERVRTMHRVLVPRTRASRPAQTQALEHSLIGRDFSGDDRDIEAGCPIPGQPHLDVVIARREQKRRARCAEVLHCPGEDAVNPDLRARGRDLETDPATGRCPLAFDGSRHRWCGRYSLGRRRCRDVRIRVSRWRGWGVRGDRRGRKRIDVRIRVRMDDGITNNDAESCVEARLEGIVGMGAPDVSVPMARSARARLRPRNRPADEG